MSSGPRGSKEDEYLSLMERVRDGHRDAFRMLVDRSWPTLVGYADSIVRNVDTAEDVVQDVFIRVWRKRQDWTAKGSVSAYLYRITRNLSLNRIRDQTARGRREELGGTDQLATAAARGGRDPHVELESEVMRRRVEEAIQGLPERRREVFILSRFHGLTHVEIADTLQISPQTVANQVSAALAQLRSELSEYIAP